MWEGEHVCCIFIGQRVGRYTRFTKGGDTSTEMYFEHLLLKIVTKESAKTFYLGERGSCWQRGHAVMHVSPRFVRTSLHKNV